MTIRVAGISFANAALPVSNINHRESSMDLIAKSLELNISYTLTQMINGSNSKGYIFSTVSHTPSMLILNPVLSQ
jgi:hypothetical protein